MVLSGIGIAIGAARHEARTVAAGGPGQCAGGGHAPDGATLDYTNRYARCHRTHRASPEEFDRIFANSGNPTVSQANVFFRTIDWDQRSRTTLDWRASCNPRWPAGRGDAFPDHAAVAGAGLSRAARQFRDHHRQLPEPGARDAQFMDEMAKNPGIVSADIDLRLNKPELASRSTASARPTWA
jgi:multidrug efflux pump